MSLSKLFRSTPGVAARCLIPLVFLAVTGCGGSESLRGSDPNVEPSRTTVMVSKTSVTLNDDDWVHVEIISRIGQGAYTLAIDSDLIEVDVSENGFGFKRVSYGFNSPTNAKISASFSGGDIEFPITIYPPEKTRPEMMLESIFSEVNDQKERVKIESVAMLLNEILRVQEASYLIEKNNPAVFSFEAVRLYDRVTEEGEKILSRSFDPSSEEENLEQLEPFSNAYRNFQMEAVRNLNDLIESATFWGGSIEHLHYPFESDRDPLMSIFSNPELYSDDGGLLPEYGYLEAINNNGKIQTCDL